MYHRPACQPRLDAGIGHDIDDYAGLGKRLCQRAVDTQQLNVGESRRRVDPELRLAARVALEQQAIMRIAPGPIAQQPIGILITGLFFSIRPYPKTNNVLMQGSATGRS